MGAPLHKTGKVENITENEKMPDHLKEFEL